MQILEGLVYFFVFQAKRLVMPFFKNPSRTLNDSPFKSTAKVRYFIQMCPAMMFTSVHDVAFLEKKIYLSLPQFNAKKGIYISLLLFEIQFF